MSKPGEKGPPVLPVPAGGEPVEWPNPVPLQLLPPDDGGQRVRVRMAQGRVALERLRDGRLVTREQAAPGATLFGYQHPGGGGKDQWYHAYHRRFDRLTTFTPKPSPLAIQTAAPLDFGLGTHELPVTLRNTGDRPVRLVARAQCDVTPVVDSLGKGVYRDLCLDWDARRLLFSFGNGSDHWDGRESYHVYEAGPDGAGLRQLTFGPKNDCEPFYLPNGQIGFTSDRSEHFVMCGADRHAPNLFVMEADGSGVRQLSFNVFNDYNPTVMPDGRILYSRWEYNERSVTSLHNPFTMNPDGTMVQPFYGNATIRPNVVMYPRPVPQSNKIMALFTAHHGQTHGAVGLIDVRRGIDGSRPLEVLTPQVPITGEKAEPSAYGWFSDPMPLSETTWLCSYTPTLLPWLERSWALYVADRHGVLGDEKLLFDSGVIRGRQSAAVDVPVEGVRQLRLMVTDAGDGYTADSADWAAARVKKKGAGIGD